MRKRALDIALSSFGLIASAPLWVVLAAAIKSEDGGPVFYGQDRVGKGGRTFRALKFRSMRPDAEALHRCRAGDRSRPAGHPRRPAHARDRDGRTAAALEHHARRHELRRSTRAAAGGNRGRRRRPARAARRRARFRAIASSSGQGSPASPRSTPGAIFRGDRSSVTTASTSESGRGCSMFD